MFLAMILFVASGEYLISWDNMLSPLDISWPNVWVDNIISLSSNTAGEINVQITVTCNVPMDLPIDTAVQMTLPGFGLSPYSITLTTPQPLADDNIFTFTGISLPSTAGNYGPLSLFITQGISGQLLASSVTFGAIGITAVVPISSGLTVSFATDASTMVYEATSLTFSMSLSVNLQPSDFIVFSIDTNFRVRSLISPDWSKSDAITAGLFNSTSMSYSDHKYNSDGTIATAGNFIIYGLQQSVNLGVNLVFTIGGFLNPKYVGANPVWTAKVMRFGTQTILQKSSGTGPGANTPGTVTGTWVPTNGYITNSQIVYGTISYMTLTFSFQHTVPKSGTITVTFNSASISTHNIGDATQWIGTFTGTFLDYSPASSLSCNALSPVVCTVSATSDLAAGSTITLYNIVTFGVSTSTVDIMSKIGINIIDSKIAVVTQANAAPSVAGILSEPKFSFSSTIKDDFITPIAAAASTGPSNSIYADMIILDSFELLITVNLRLPITISTSIQETSISLTTSAFVHGSTGPVDTMDFNPYLTEFVNVSIGKNSITATLATTIVANNHISMQIGAGTIATPSTLSLPFFASSVGTRYEVLISYTTSANVFKYYSKPFWIDKASIDTFWVRFPCSNPGSPAIPISIYITSPYAYSPSNSYLPYFEFAFTIAGVSTTDLGSGLATGATYPFSLPSGNLFLGSSSLLYSPLIALFTFPPLAFIVPIKTPTSGASSISVIATLYANRTADGKKFTMAASSASSVSTATATNTASAAFIMPASLLASGVGTLFTFTAVAPTTVSVQAITATLIFVLPQGWSFPSGATGRLGGGSSEAMALVASSAAASSSALIVLSSTDPALKWTIGYKTAYTLYSNAFVAAQLSSATASSFTTGSSSSIWAVFGKHSGDFMSIGALDYCELSLEGTITVGPAIMTSPKYSPLTSEGYGINVQTANLQITLTLPLTVTIGSVFSAGIGADFITSGSKCTITSGTFTQSGISVIGNFCTSTPALLTVSIPSGSTVSFTVFDVIVPIIYIPNTIKAGFTHVLVSSNSNPYMSYTDSWAGDDKITRTTFSVGSTTVGTSTISTLQVIPNSLGAKLVHLQIKFKLSLAAPNRAKITFTGENFAFDTNTKYTCWLSVGYSAVTISGRSITFTLNQAIPAGTIIEMRKDKAFDIPSTPPSIWLISVGLDFLSSNIINDLESTNSLNKLTYVNYPAPFISSTSISLTVSNIGFASLHTFKFIPGVDVTDSTFILFEAPFEYNAHIGPTVVYNELPSVYWLSASSSFPGALSCNVDHWTIICSGFDNITSTSLIDISIYLSNPAALSVKWSIYIMSQDFSLLSNPAYDIPATFTPLPTAGIDLYNITHEIPAAVSSTYTLYVKLSDNYAAGSSIVVRFPHIYDLKVYNPGAIACQAWFNTSSGVTSFVAPGSYCKVNMNDVIFNITTDAPFGGLWTTLQLKEVSNPTEGLIKKPTSDITQKTAINYDFWSTKFVVYTFASATSTTISSMSIENLNAGYTGFFKGTWLTVSINGGKMLYVTPGTLSTAYTIGSNSTTVSAYNLTMIPSDQNARSLKFDSESYELTINKPSTLFRVGLPSSSAAGYYYITWNLIETPLTSGILLYKPPRKTTVQAFLNSKTTVKVSISEILTVSAKFGSFPISVSLAGGVTPFSGLNITLTESSSSFNFTPSLLVFNPGESMKSFSIQVTKNITSDKTFYVNLTLIGSDSIAFSPKIQLAPFTVGSTYSTPANITTYLRSSGKVSVAISLDTNSSGIATWALISSNLASAYYDYNFLLSLAAPAAGEPSGNQTTVDQQVQTWIKKINSIDQSDWQAYSLSVLKLSQTIFFCGQVFVNSGNGQKIQSFNELIANTSYTAAVWLDNLSGLNATLSIATVMTDPLDNAIQIDLSFGDTLGESNGPLLAVAISQSMLIQSSRVIQSGNLTISRRLSTKASYLFLGSLTSSTSNRETFKSLTPNTVYNNAKALNVPVTSAPSVESMELQPEDYGIPQLNDTYWNLTDKTLPVFGFTTAVDGSVCCAYQLNDSTPLSSNEIFLKMNQYQEYIDDQITCWSVIENGQYQKVPNMPNYTEEGNITFSCTACNALPITSLCLSDDEVVVETFERKILSFSFSEYAKIALLIIGIAFA